MIPFDENHIEEFLKDSVIPNWDWIQKKFPNVTQEQFAKILSMGWEIKSNWDMSEYDGDW